MPITAQSPGSLAREDVLLGGDIARHVAVAVDMVGRDVEPDRDIGAEGLEQLELVGRELQHIDAARAERRQIERAAADIAADFAAPAGLGEDVADQRRRRRLAVGAGDADEAAPVGWARASSSMSQMICLPAARAAAATGCGLGRWLGMPGLMTSAVDARPVDATPDRRARRRSSAAASRDAALSSQATQSIPAAFRARTVARPERASPSTTNDEPLSTPRSIIRSPQFQGGETGHRQDGGDDPEAEDDGGLGPALLLEMMVQRRHAEDALAGPLEGQRPGRSPTRSRARTGRRRWRARSRAW